MRRVMVARLGGGAAEFGRGGSGNFGVVMSFEYRPHPVSSAIAGLLVYPIAKAGQVFRFYREFDPQLPDAFGADISVFTAPDGY